MNTDVLFLKAKRETDHEAAMHDCRQAKQHKKGNLTVRQEIFLTVLTLCGCGYRVVDTIRDHMPLSSASGKLPTVETIRNVLHKDIYPICRNVTNLPEYELIETVLKQFSDKYSIAPLRLMSADVLRFEKLPNNGDFNQLKTRAPEFIVSVESTVAQHKETDEPLNPELKSKFEDLVRKANGFVGDGNVLCKRGDDCHFKYRAALECFLAAIKINPLEKTLFEQSLWLRAARCYIKLGFYRYAVIFCDYALSNIFLDDWRKSRAYMLLAYSFDDLMIEKGYFSEEEIVSIFQCCDLALFYNPNHLLPRWHIAELFVNDFQRNRKNLNRAESALEDFIARLKSRKSRNSRDKYSNRIDDDANRVLNNSWWHPKRDEILSLLKSF
jgi:tetratricopeptide (TPR) repeat protein